MKRNLEVHPGYVKDRKKIKLSNDQLTKIKNDINDLCSGIEKGKLLSGNLFPMMELKYRSWGIRVVFVIEDNSIILLSINRKKDDVTKAYADANKRKNG